MKGKYEIKQLSDQAVRITQDCLREIPEAANVARVLVITAEKQIRVSFRRSLRVVAAAVFFCLSGLFSIGANVSIALAKKAPTTQRRAKGHTKLHTKQLGKLADKRPSRSVRKTGVASWYGGKFHNRKTASGERFDTYAMTAAHKTLPFGTKVLVTNLANDRFCVVEITDRGPYVGKRVLDLSYAAAKELGFASKGTAQIAFEVLPVVEDFNFASNVVLSQPTFDVLQPASLTEAAMIEKSHWEASLTPRR